MAKIKSNYIRSRSETERIAREAAREELKKQKQTVCPECETMITNQVCAVMCMTLHNVFGFGRKRLERLLYSAQGLAEYINGKHPEGLDKKEYTPQIAVEWLKEIGIDLENIT